MASIQFVLTLVIGISVGFSFAYIILTSSGFTREVSLSSFRKSVRGLERHRHYELAHKSENHSVADQLAKKVRVLCWIMTQPVNHDKKARHVKATWGKRCNILVFMSSAEDPSLPTVKLPVQEGRNHLWSKTKAAFKYVYEHFRKDADWFMKADDDTYVIVENLRYLLSKYSPYDPTYFGYRFNNSKLGKQGFMSGGAGYVLSSAALERFVHKGLPSPHFCETNDSEAEDVKMSICLEPLGVKAMDSRDELKRARFFPYQPTYFKTRPGLDCFSNHAITFHYIKPEQMYLLDYLIYHLRPYGIAY